MAAEGEECGRYEGLRAVEPERDAGERADLGVCGGSGACRPHGTPELCWHRGVTSITDRFVGRTRLMDGRSDRVARALGRADTMIVVALWSTWTPSTAVGVNP